MGIQSAANMCPFQFELVIACDAMRFDDAPCERDSDDDDDDEENDKDDEDTNGDVEDTLGDVVKHRVKGNGLRHVSVALSPSKVPRGRETFDFQHVDSAQHQQLLQMVSLHWLKAPLDYKISALSLVSAVRHLREQSLRHEFDAHSGTVPQEIVATICDFELSASDVGAHICSILDTQSMGIHSHSLRQDLKCINDAFQQFVRTEERESLHHRRLCMFVDRRRSDYERPQHRFSDSVTFYAPKGSDELRVPENGCLFSETFFDLSRKCVIPESGDDDKSSVTCRTTAGNVLIFSFHVISPDVTRCYLYRQGQSIRFLPRDIKDVLPRLFADSPENLRFVKNEEHISALAARLNFSDKLFDAWYN